MIILPRLTTSLIHFSIKGWEDLSLNLGVKGLIHINRDSRSKNGYKVYEYIIAPAV